MKNIAGKMLFAFVAILFGINNYAIAQTHTRQDTLRGSIGEGRKHWNVIHYNISIRPDIINKSITGSNTISMIDSGVSKLQLDLQEPMEIDSIICNGKHFPFTREANVYWVDMLHEYQETNIQVRKMTVYFHGKPRAAKRAPWDGGWVWTKDKLGNPWVSVACQGLGASVWYPCKDVQSDEPDNGCLLRIIVPDTLQAVGNGRLQSVEKVDSSHLMYQWKVTAPINNYDIIPYIGKYTHFTETYKGVAGNLDMDYWVLNYNLEKAKKHFSDAPKMMKALEFWLGPYPFYEDGYKLVDAPYLGMEHQSAVAYGNGYMKGYLGSDRSKSGWGTKWDFIIIHESGHEWFGNNITTTDIADMWVHEAFTDYAETLFTSYYYGNEAGEEYVTGLRANIENDIPIIGPYGVNREGSGDMYDKGANMIHMIRLIMNDDSAFRKLLIGLNTYFYHQTVTSAQVEKYISEQSGIDFTSVFNQYLRTTTVPVLAYHYKRRKLFYKWEYAVDGFTMPLKVTLNNKDDRWIYPVNSKKKIRLPFKIKDVKVNRGFYVTTRNDSAVPH